MSRTSTSGSTSSNLADGFATVVGDLDGPAFVVQRHLDQVGQRRFVVDQQDPDR